MHCPLVQVEQDMAVEAKIQARLAEQIIKRLTMPNKINTVMVMDIIKEGFCVNALIWYFSIIKNNSTVMNYNEAIS